MGCVNSKTADKPSSPTGGGVKYTPPDTITTSSQPAPHRTVSPQSSQHRTSMVSGVGSQNGGIVQPPLPSVPSPMPDDGSLYVARYAYQARTSEDLSFEKGEQLKVCGNSLGVTMYVVGEVHGILVLWGRELKLCKFSSC